MFVCFSHSSSTQGCGKSTLLNLLFANYECDHGQVLLLGKNVCDLSEEVLRANLSLVPQEPFLFNTTIANNIGYGLGERQSRDTIEQAAVGCNIHDFICSLPLGYDTLVGTNGHQLSGGQRQRICIARALANSESGILCLDEPTSSLDFTSARIVAETLKSLLMKRDRSVILITHQLSLMKWVDRVVFLKEGKVHATGTHAELCASSKEYLDLFGL